MTDISVQTTGFAITGEARALIDEAIAKLQSLDPEMQRCHVTVDAPVAHHRSGGPFAVHIDLTLAGKVITVSHREAPELNAAIHAAFDAARRQLEEYHRRLRDLARHP